LQHRIDTYPLTADLSVGVNRYEKGKAFVVPADQRQYRMVRSLFEKVTQFSDSIFYDASTWTMALAYNMPHDALNATVKFSKCEKLKLADVKASQALFAKSGYAYLVEWTDYNAPQFLHHLLKNNVFVKTSFKPFSAQVNGVKKQFGYGTLVTAVADQNLDADA